MDGYEKLALAIIEQAARDLILAVGENDKETIDECKRFLESHRCEFYSCGKSKPDVEGIVKKANIFYDKCKETTKEGIKHKHRPKNTEMAFVCPICGQKVSYYYGYITNIPSLDKSSYGYRYICDGCKIRHIDEVEKRKNTKDKKEHASRTLTYHGETKTYAEWADLTGLSTQLIQYRIRNGWSTEKTLETRARKK